MEKVYCKDCKFYKKWKFSDDDCLDVVIQEWSATESRRVIYGNPKKINKRNNCKKFMQKK